MTTTFLAAALNKQKMMMSKKGHQFFW